MHVDYLDALELAMTIVPRVQDEAKRDALAAKCDELIARAKATVAARAGDNAK